MSRFRWTVVSLLQSLCLLTLTLSLSAQNSARTTAASDSEAKGHTGITGPFVGEEDHHDISPTLRELLDRYTPRIQWQHEAEEVRIRPRPSATPDQIDHALQSRSNALPLLTVTTGLNFDGLTDSQCNCEPPDTDGAVGTTQYVQQVNGQFAVYDKTGALLYGPFPTQALFSGFGGDCQSEDNGDGVVLFDHIANRWVISQFALGNNDDGPYQECVAVSTSDDATGTYARYAFSYSGFNDYPKLGLWPDAYYISFNNFGAGGNDFEGTISCALNSAAMQAGTTANQVCFNQDANTGYSLLPSDVDGATPPPAGEPNFFVQLSDVPANYNNGLDLFTFHVDWVNTANSTFTGPTTLIVDSFNSPCDFENTRDCVPQKGTTAGLDSLGDRLMFRNAYRNFGDHESLLLNHAVAPSANPGSPAGVRWYEIQNPNGTPTIAQQSTFAPDSNYRWMGSLAFDGSGDMALGYSESSSSLYPSIAIAGRVPSDPPSTLESEIMVFSGTGSQTDNQYFRWGDYSAMSLDPTDDCTFWYTQEYIKTSGAFNWDSRIVTFRFPGCLTGSQTAVGSSANPSAYGQAVSFTATVSSITTHGSTPTGSVQFVVDGSAFGSPITLVAGSATSGSTSTLAEGNHTVTVTYGGDSSFSGSSATLSGGQQVNAASSSMMVASNLNPSTYGQQVTFTATIGGEYGQVLTPRGKSNKSGPQPQDIGGTVTWTDNTQCGETAVVSGAATCSTTTLGAGNNAIEAVYSGDENHSGTTAFLNGGQTVNQADATTAVASNINPSTPGQSVTFTATISGAYGQIRKNGNSQIKNGHQPQDVSGSVAWSANTGCGTTAVTLGNPGVATCVTSTLPSGNNVITANYQGDVNHNASTGTLSGGQQVGPLTQTITFTQNAPTSAPYNSSFTVAASASSGLPVTFTSAGSCTNVGPTYTMTNSIKKCSVVANQAGGNGYPPAPTVTQITSATKASQVVSFTGAPTTAPYQATFTVSATTNSGITPTLTAHGACSISGTTVTMTSGTGTCSMEASWASNAYYKVASATQTTAAEKVVSTISWATPAPIVYGTPLSSTQLNATANVPGTFTYVPAAGKVLTVGSYTLSVTFKPSSPTDDTTATDSVTLVVNPVGTTTTITSNLPNPSKAGKPVSVHFTVTPATNHTAPTGSVTVNASTGESCTAKLSGGSASCPVTFLTSGQRTLTATYAGDGNNNGSVSDQVTQTVN